MGNALDWREPCEKCGGVVTMPDDGGPADHLCVENVEKHEWGLPVDEVVMNMLARYERDTGRWPRELRLSRNDWTNLLYCLGSRVIYHHDHGTRPGYGAINIVGCRVYVESPGSRR